MRLTDSGGGRQSVVVPKGMSVLAHHPGYMFEFELFETMQEGWAGYIPLGELRIPLTYFDGINLAEIARAEIAFDQTLSGAIMLAGIYLK